MKNSIHWFRKGLRIHDNLALLEAAKNADKVYPIFIIDPMFSKPHIIGVNRYNFLLETLSDLDKNLRQLGSRLYVLRGKPEIIIPQIVEQWQINCFTYEVDTEPYAKIRDETVSNYLRGLGNIELHTHCTHTIFHPENYLAVSKGAVPTTYQGFQKLFELCGKVRECYPVPTRLPSIPEEDANNIEYDVPTLKEMGYTEPPTCTEFLGGESEALKRLEWTVLEREAWVASFEKPNTSPNSLEPSTTVSESIHTFSVTADHFVGSFTISQVWLSISSKIL